MNPKTSEYPFVSADVDTAKLLERTKKLIARDVDYGFGSKAVDLTAPPENFRGTKGLSVDCSGFVRYALWPWLQIPDGSVNQRDWFKKQGFKPSKQFSEKDGRLRIAFLSPGQTPSGIGHVMLVLNGMTLESHGGKGVDMRAWGSKAFMSKCTGFVIDPTP